MPLGISNNQDTITNNQAITKVFNNQKEPKEKLNSLFGD
jgi:hypothetical protein